LSREDFEQFLQRYEDHGGSKVSEPYFYELLKDIIGDRNVMRHHKVRIPVVGRSPTYLPTGIIKKFDFFIEPNILVELKKNIDLVEKDLFKWMLLKDKSYKRIQLIFEEKLATSQCSIILDHALFEGWLNDWFYFTPESFEAELKRLGKVLSAYFQEPFLLDPWIKL
jgi:hypothetical protein